MLKCLNAYKQFNISTFKPFAVTAKVALPGAAESLYSLTKKK